MSRIKGKDTAPEVYLRKLLWSRGLRYLKNYEKLLGKPNIFVLRYDTAIFVNGCFWHRHSGCRNVSIPSTNAEFWMKKFQKNIERDRKNYYRLYERKIKIVLIWECLIRKMKKDSAYEKIIIENIVKFIC